MSGPNGADSATGAASPSTVIVVGASAGGVEGLRALVAGFPADLDAAVLVVLHVPRGSASALPSILSRSGPLPATHAVDGERLRPGRILVAPADHHLLVIEGQARLSHGPSENGHRPAVDPLFRSAARAFGPRTVAVVLSGARDDGTAGAVSVAGTGGAVFVQASGDALYPSMPCTARDAVGTVVELPAASMGAAVAEVVVKLSRTRPAVPDRAGSLLARETAVAGFANVTPEDFRGEPAGLGCPSCHGALFELPGQPSPRFRCRVGHAWSPESLLDEQAAALEGALWMALRSLEEKAALSRRMAGSARQRGSLGAAERYDSTGTDNEEASRLIRELIERLSGLTGTPLERAV